MHKHTPHADTNPSLVQQSDEKFGLTTDLTCCICTRDEKVLGLCDTTKKTRACISETLSRRAGRKLPRTVTLGDKQKRLRRTETYCALCFRLKPHQKRDNVSACISAFASTVNCRGGLVLLAVVWIRPVVPMCWREMD